MLTIGREMNGFQDWSTATDKNEAIQQREILQRAKEIENMLTVKHEVAISKRIENQDKQRQIQDLQANLRNEPLTPGTRVMLKREGF